jgi:uncharacterized Zn finger protein
MMARRRRTRTRVSRFDDYNGYDGYGGWGGFAPYVPVAARKAQAARKILSLKKSGRQVSPVQIAGRKIATTFWGAAWCDNLERYSDYANRIPRGRTYVRNGSVIDLQIGGGRVGALVSGSSLYTVAVKVAPVPARQWQAIRVRCAGGIDSLVELLQGRFSKGVMGHLCQQGTGLFPTPEEIEFSCSCPDGAYMCKHVAAVLYGIGARLDHQPELLFRLRKVNEQDLIASAAADAPLSKKAPAAGKVLDPSDVAGVFGVEFVPAAPLPASKRKAVAASRSLTRAPAIEKKATQAAGKPKAPTTARKPKFTAAQRKAISERMRRYWEARRRG